jgi:hypothetical protein
MKYYKKMSISSKLLGVMQLTNFTPLIPPESGEVGMG